MTPNLFKSETHLFASDRRLILFDVLGGQFFEADEVSRDVLDRCAGQSSEEIVRDLSGRHERTAVQAALEDLERAEVLTREPVRIAPFHPPSRVEVTHLSLCLTRDEADGRRRKTGALYMPEAVALGAVDFLMRESGGMQDCEISFEGGEPLLNLPLLRRVVRYGEERAGDLGKRVAFEVVTDGTLLTHRVVDGFAEEGIDLLLRVTPEAGPEPLNRMASLLGGYPRLIVEVITGGQGEDIPGRVASLLGLFPSASCVCVHWEAGIPQENLADVLRSLDGMHGQTLRHILNGKEASLEPLEGAITQLMERQALFYGCGAGTRSVAVSPEGDLFPCTDLTGRRSLRMGDVFGGIDDARYRRWMQDLHVERRESCRTCWARYLCGGGCWADAMQATGGVKFPNPVSCARIRRTYELAMAICVEAEDVSPGLLASRYPGGEYIPCEVPISDEHPVLERYA